MKGWEEVKQFHDVEFELSQTEVKKDVRNVVTLVHSKLIGKDFHRDLSYSERLKFIENEFTLKGGNRKLYEGGFGLSDMNAKIQKKVFDKESDTEENDERRFVGISALSVFQEDVNLSRKEILLSLE